MIDYLWARPRATTWMAGGTLFYLVEMGGPAWKVALLVLWPLVLLWLMGVDRNERG